MRSLIRVFLASLVGLICSSSAKAQDFPAAEKEVGEILCTGKWVVDSAGKPGKMTTAAEAMMDDVALIFKNDGTYTITFFGRDKVGKWNADMTGKKVKIFEKDPEPESVVVVLKKERLVMVKGDGTDDFTLVFKPAK